MKNPRVCIDSARSTCENPGKSDDLATRMMEPYRSTNKGEHPDRVLSGNRVCWDAGFGPLISIVDKHGVDNCLVLKNPMPRL